MEFSYINGEKGENANGVATLKNSLALPRNVDCRLSYT